MNNIYKHLLDVDNGEPIQNVLNNISSEIMKNNFSDRRLEKLYDVLWYFNSNEFINPKSLKIFNMVLDLLELGGDINTFRKIVKKG